MSNTVQTRAWIEVAPSALRANYAAIRSRVGPATAIIAMVKADGYGLGAERVARILEPLDPFAFGVATAEEGMALRAAGFSRRIIVFGPLPPQAVDLAAANRLTATISSIDALQAWRAAAERYGPLDFHVEIDTGMGRAGLDWRQTGDWAQAVREQLSERLQWSGVFTHFHGADAPDHTPTAVQWERFRDALAQLPVSTEDLLVHAANSAAAVRWPEYAADAVRPGIFLYGGHPAPGTDALAPEPVASVKARVVLVREVPPGSTVGYGATHVARSPERWATLAIGYGDGLPRALGNTGVALVGGQRVPITGRISMDMTVVNVSTVSAVAPGDEVVFLGRQGVEEIRVEEMAEQVGTINYEILTGFTPRLPRVERMNG